MATSAASTFLLEAALAFPERLAVHVVFWFGFLNSLLSTLLAAAHERLLAPWIPEHASLNMDSSVPAAELDTVTTVLAIAGAMAADLKIRLREWFGLDVEALYTNLRSQDAVYLTLQLVFSLVLALVLASLLLSTGRWAARITIRLISTLLWYLLLLFVAVLLLVSTHHFATYSPLNVEN